MSQTVKDTQKFLNDHGFDPGPIDGIWGARTENAYDELKDDLEGVSIPFLRPEEVSNGNPNDWPKQDEDSLNAFYGEPGENLVMVNLPYPMKLSWDTDTKVSRTRCNEKVKDSLVRVLTKVKAHYGMAEIERLGLDIFGGCFLIRNKRGGSTASTHSWGIALDFDPDNNKLRWGRDKASFAGKEYDFWWKCWEEEGWVSLGRKLNFDYMHVQAAKL